MFSAWFAVSPGFACGQLAGFKHFWPPALAQQALLAIILQALCRLRGAVLFHRVGPSLSWGCPFWVLGLTRQSSRPAYCGRLTLGVSPHKTLIFRPCFFKRHLVSQALFNAWLAVSPGFACGQLGSFKHFWPPALMQQASLAIILQALRRLRGAVLFHRVGPSLSWGFLFWLLGLTRQSSRPASGGRLTLGVRTFFFHKPLLEIT